MLVVYPTEYLGQLVKFEVKIVIIKINYRMLDWYTSIVESSCAYSGLGRHIYLRMENFQLAL